MVFETRRRKVIGALGGLIVLGACASATDPDDDDDNGGSDDTEPSDDSGEPDVDDSSADDGGNDSAEESDDGDDDSAEDSEPEVSGPEPQSFSGSGASVEDGVSIEGGLTVIEASHSGSSNFQVQLVGDGDFDDLFVNVIGEYDGETADLIEADDYQLDVEADGDWSIEVRQPRAGSGDSPGSLSSSGPEVHGPFEFSGSHTASVDHSGESNLAVHVFPPEGQFPELLFNEIGAYDGQTTFRHDGVGYIAVQADGDWSLDIE